MLAVMGTTAAAARRNKSKYGIFRPRAAGVGCVEAARSLSGSGRLFHTNLPVVNEGCLRAVEGIFMGEKRVTIQDIADKMHISKALVSLALSDKYGASEEMRSKIFLTAMDMGYNFNNKRQRQIEGHKRLNIMLTFHREHLMEVNYWLNIIIGAEQYLKNNNVNFVISTWDDWDLSELPTRFYQSECQGIVLCGVQSPDIVDAIAKLHRPLVMIDCEYIGTGHTHVRANNYGSAYEVANYILDKGHRDLCYVGAKGFAYSYDERLRGWSDCLAQRREEDVRCRFFTSLPRAKDPEREKRDTGFKIFDWQLFEAYIAEGNRPSAIFCVTDHIAFDVFEILEKYNIRIPDDISVIGFDGFEKSTYLKPPLTTVSIPTAKMGEMAVKLLLDMVRGESQGRMIIELAPKIVERDSVRAL